MHLWEKCGVRGFTLVELLVVVAIIAAIMSAALPSMARAQKQGEQVACLANERQLIIAWILYAQDNDDYLCVPDKFVEDLEDYVEEKDEIFVCASLEGLNEKDSYGISNTMGGEARDGVVPFGKLHKISSAPGRMVLIDTDPDSGECFWPILREDLNDPNDPNDHNSPWLWRPWSYPASRSVQNMTSRHNNGSNMAFADGHCAYRRWRDHRTVKLIKGLLVETEEASEDNDDLTDLVDWLTH